MRALLVPVALSLITLVGCASAVDMAAEEAAIRTADSEMVAALNAHDIERWLTFLTSDVRMMPPGAPAVVGKDAVRSLITGFMSPEFAVAHHLEGVVVSRSADLAYVWYAYELTFLGPDGTAVTEEGKDLSVHRKATDGSWKLAVDMWSENQPPTPPS